MPSSALDRSATVVPLIVLAALLALTAGVGVLTVMPGRATLLQAADRLSPDR
jgi:hypothetical protein